MTPPSGPDPRRECQKSSASSDQKVGLPAGLSPRANVDKHARVPGQIRKTDDCFRGNAVYGIICQYGSDRKT
jgi:hypothetical protein